MRVRGFFFIKTGGVYALSVLSMKSAIFIERDGILTLPRVERQQQVTPATLDEFKVNKSAAAGLEQLKRAGFVLIATTNQPGISRGSVTRHELERMHALLMRTFPLDDILVCPHDEMDHCPCRKPSAGLFTEAAFKWQVDLERSFVISDKWQDARAARAAGCTSMLIQSAWIGSGHHDFVLANFEVIVAKILQLQARHLAA
jgi:D-glycero-D-manno-heptose 1,7-bisphosphate phosphatase